MVILKNLFLRIYIFIIIFFNISLLYCFEDNEFMYIDGGSFFIGSDSGRYEDEYPLKEVILNSFYISRYETTYGKWNTIYIWALTNGYDFDNIGQNGSDVYWNAFDDSYDYPVVGINWYDVVKWCNAISEFYRLTPCYYMESSKTNIYRNGIIKLGSSFVDWTSEGYRLPTEAEWEYAARGGVNSEYFWGEDIYEAGNYANIADKSVKLVISNWNIIDTYDGFLGTSLVGTLEPNGYGIYDMIGNVWEWCFDIYGKYRNNAVRNPKGATSGNLKVFRGSSFENYGIDNLRVSKRMAEYPYFREVYLGFRVVRSRI